MSKLTISEFIESAHFSKFITGKKSLYYKQKFREIIEASKIENAFVKNITYNDIMNGLKPQNIGFKRFLPFTDKSLYNWGAFFFTIWWGAWRGIVWKWSIIAVFCALLVLDDIITFKYAYSFFPIAGSVIGVTFALYGTPLLLFGIVREIQTCNIRHEPTSIKDLAIFILVFFNLCLLIFLAGM